MAVQPDHLGAFMSSDGNFIAYSSAFSSPNNTVHTIALLDRKNNTTTLINTDNSGNAVSSSLFLRGVSNDGNKVLIESDSAIDANDTNGTRDLYLYDRATQQSTRVTPNFAAGIQLSQNPFARARLSGDGQWVAYPVYDFNNSNFGDIDEIYLHNVQSAQTHTLPKPAIQFFEERELDSLDISDDGQTIAFSTLSQRDIDFQFFEVGELYHYDNTTQTTRLIDMPLVQVGPPPYITETHISGNGEFVFFSSFNDLLTPNDFNFSADIFRLNLQDDSIDMVSFNETGDQLNFSTSEGYSNTNGNILTFATFAGNIGPNSDPNAFNVPLSLYQRNIDTGDVTLVSKDITQMPVSAMGSFSTFAGISDNGDINLFFTAADVLNTGVTPTHPQLYLVNKNVKHIELITPPAPFQFSDNNTEKPVWKQSK
ncbi:MAG: hypothetical protein MI750_06670 [Xanthomonadales bacterium]|nr:hypothetical protein [Xanthomonadales bacterium]